MTVPDPSPERETPDDDDQPVIEPNGAAVVKDSRWLSYCHWAGTTPMQGTPPAWLCQPNTDNRRTA